MNWSHSKARRQWFLFILETIFISCLLLGSFLFLLTAARPPAKAKNLSAEGNLAEKWGQGPVPLDLSDSGGRLSTDMAVTPGLLKLVALPHLKSTPTGRFGQNSIGDLATGEANTLISETGLPHDRLVPLDISTEGGASLAVSCLR